MGVVHHRLIFFMSKKTFRRYLDSLSEAELREALLKLYDKFPEVKQFYLMELGEAEDRETVLQVYREQLRDLYFGAYRTIWTPVKASEAQNILKAFKKVAVFPHELVDILLHRVEQALKASQCFGFQGYPFYDSATSSYRQALDLIEKEKLQALFSERLETLIEAAKRDWLYWGEELQALRDKHLPPA